MNPSSIRFVLEALLHGAHMQMSLEVLHKDLKSDEHLDESSWVFRKCQRLQCCLADDVVILGAYTSAPVNVSAPLTILGRSDRDGVDRR